MRTCSICGEEMWCGYFVELNEEYYCSDECLHKMYSEEEYMQMYGDDEAYWTEWDDE